MLKRASRVSLSGKNTAQDLKKQKRRKAKSPKSIAYIKSDTMEDVQQIVALTSVADSLSSTPPELSLEHESFADTVDFLDYLQFNFGDLGDDAMDQMPDMDVMEELSQDTMDEFDYLQQNPMSEDTKLEEITKVPEIEEVEAEEEQRVEVKKPKRRKFSLLGLTGDFVEPLTGKFLKEPTPPPTPPPVVVDKKKKPLDGDQAGADEQEMGEGFADAISDRRASESSEDEEDSFSELFALDRALAVELAPLEVKKTEEEEQGEMMKAIMIKETPVEIKVDLEDEFEREELIRQEEERKLKEAVDTYLNSMIRQCVDYCDEVERITELRNSLDKRVIASELSAKIEALQVETIAFEFIYQKAVEFFFKKKSWAHISPVYTPESFVTTARYKKSLEDLDILLGRKRDTQVVIRENLEECQNDQRDMEERVERSWHNLETTIWKICKRDDREDLKAAIRKCIRTIKTEGGHMSKLRKKIILRQHEVATLVDKINNLMADYGDIDFNDYDRLTTQIVSIQKKIEERNSDFIKFRMRMNNDMHFRAHIKERKIMAKNLLHHNSVSYEEVKERLAYLKHELFNVGMERLMVQEKTLKLMESSSLNHRTLLLHEYDETVDKIAEKREQINGLRIHLKDLEDKYYRFTGIRVHHHS